MSYLGESIPKLGFGLMRLPRLEDGETIDIEQVKQMVDTFLEAGGTYFDTARAYGESENAIRQALVERYPRESFQLATKNAAWIGPKSYEDARKDFDISIENTGAGYFDFYLIHNTGGARTKVFDDLEMWDFVKQLKADGRVKHIGFSHHDSAAVLEEVIKAHPEMEFVQLQVNWADWDNANTQSRKCVEVARKHGLPVIIMEPVRGGTLANPPEAVAEILHEGHPDWTHVEWAIRFALGTEGLITMLSGMSSLEQMEQNIDKFGPWTDLYALGATMYNLLTRNQPPSPSDIDEDAEAALPMPATISKKTRDFLALAQKRGQVVNVSYELPKSFIVCEQDNQIKVYISQLSAKTLSRRELRIH